MRSRSQTLIMADEEEVDLVDGDMDAEEPEESGGMEGETKGPRDEIKVTVKSFQKTASDCTYEIQVEVNGHVKVIHRNYKDFLWLHRMLNRRIDLGGYILPPMPAPPPQSLSASTEILGDSSRALFGNISRTPCMALEVFLQSLADHRFFSENHTVRDYLTNEQRTPHDQLGAGSLWSHITKALTDYQLGGIPESEEEFVKFHKYIDMVSPLLHTTAQDFAQVISAWQKLACSVVSVVEALKQNSTFEETRNTECSSYFIKFSGGLEEEKIHMHAVSLDARHSFGFTVDFYHSLFRQSKEMVFRRLAKLQTLLTCTNQLDKAKPDKKDAAEAAKADAEKALHSISETAREEVELLKQHYVKSFHDSLLSYTESQITHSKRTLENLAKVKEDLEN